MKPLPILLFFTGILFPLANFFKLDFAKKSLTSARQKVIAYKQQNTFRCGLDFSSFNLSDPTNTIPLLQGWGNYELPVTVTNDSAHIYFEQGINMYYGFHIIESLASFEKATRFDSAFAMGYWGKALAYGPNINDFGYSASPEALASMKKAKELFNNCTSLEKSLIEAMQVRYSPDTTQTREHLNQQYADAMKQVYLAFPASADAAALYADALMIQHPWNLYDAEGKPKSWTPEIVSVLETALKINSKHPGAAHYYIHAIEGSDHPEAGLSIANELPQLMPGVAHLVHMPSHIFIRSGYYKEGIEVNEKAVRSYYNYLENYSPVLNNAVLYLSHNLHMQATCANMDGRFAEALKISNECQKTIDSSFLDAGGYMGIFAQYVYMTPFLTYIRFGEWDKILAEPAIPESRVYANILWHYGRGLAYARKNFFEKANIELQEMQKSMSDLQLKEHPPAFNPGIAGASVAEKILMAIIAEQQDDLTKSITLLKNAVKLEDGMLYNEPKDWVHPVRQYLGEVLIKANYYSEAERMYKEDLKINPNNGWSLTGLATTQFMQGKKAASNATQQAAKNAFARSDVKITASVF